MMRGDANRGIGPKTKRVTGVSDAAFGDGFRGSMPSGQLRRRNGIPLRQAKPDWQSATREG